jgi:hypothetical protein
MSTSELRLAANRINALGSTGPKTETGKSTASANATRHGLLSHRMFLDDEDPDAFDALLLELQTGLLPVGSMELTLVERIAVTLWRQRRLVTAETAAISLTREAPKITAAVGKEAGRGYSNELKAKELVPFDQERIGWCKTVVAEIENLEQIDLATLAVLAPLAFGQLQSEADEDKELLADYLKVQEGGLTGFIDRLLAWCQTQLREAENRPRLLALAEQVRARRLILPDDMLDVFSRYQSTLDNQLYKALRALRDAQEWRLKTLEASNPVSASSQIKAA